MLDTKTDNSPRDSNNGGESKGHHNVVIPSQCCAVHCSAAETDGCERPGNESYTLNQKLPQKKSLSQPSHNLQEKVPGHITRPSDSGLVSKGFANKSHASNVRELSRDSDQYLHHASG